MLLIFCCKLKTAYEFRICDLSSDVCSSDLDTTGLGILGSSADRIRSNYRVDLPALRPDATAFERSSRDSISRNGEMSARDAAISEAAYGVTAQRTTRSEERREGKECGSPRRSRWSPVP